MHTSQNVPRYLRPLMQRERDAAFASRKSWRRTLVELILDHAPDEDNGRLCLCGESYPCTSRRLLPSLNRGMANEVIHFEGMPPDQRETELDGRRWTMMDELESIYYDRRSA